MEWSDSIEKIDKFLFLFIHTDSDQQWLDTIMLAIRNQYTWIPLYLFICLYSIFKTGNNFWLLIFASILTFAFTDVLSAQILKPIFERPRPCYDAELQPFIRNIIDCGGRYSFPSSHACNHFGLATVWYLFFKKYELKNWKWLFLWAAAIAYAQVYVGKHFPLDVLTGAAIGTFMGFAAYNTVSYFFNKLFHFNFQRSQETSNS